MCGGDPDYVEASQYEKQLVDLADRQLAHYNELYVPLEYQQMADVDRYRSNTFKQGSMDKSVNAARMASTGNAQAAPGMNPGTGNLMLQSMAREQQVGNASALGAMSGLQTAEDLSAQGRLNLAATGQKQRGTQMNLTSTMAQQQAGVLAAQKAAEQTVKDSYWGAAGAIAGGAAAGYYAKSNKPKTPLKPETPGGMYDENGAWLDLSTF